MLQHDSGAGESTLQVDGFGLSMGRVSVGLPLACTSDVVLLRYLDLLRLVHGRDVAPCSADVVVLAAATGLTETQARERLRRLGAAI